ncbi:hypothetical protein ACWGHM_39105 [Streptomyces sp. NPDC054904]|uniref:hypothetical protein n=1 Tax=unclassified Streptomyces TaxID=2593676 RepID=UPI0024819CFC|nr:MULTISPECIES: hypothetical protein [unclassified Streptomyces]MDA5285596.1 hypothetical protein [Streptomyces sp. Isolate_45]MDX2394186.1 hypothetical protein [Streptomyces sp. DK15]
MNAVQIAGYWVPARDPVRESAHAAARPCAPTMTTLLRRRARWGLAVARGRSARRGR